MNLLRIVTWNCRIGAFRRKAHYVAALEPDVLVVQEVEPLDSVMTLSGDRQPSFRQRLTDVRFPRRSIGVFSYTDAHVEPVDMDEPDHSFRRFRVRKDDLTFQVAAVWTSATASTAMSYRQAHDALVRHGDWMRELPTVVVGDFNANRSFRGRNWADLEALLEASGHVSAYHHHASESFGGETCPTHFPKGRTSGATHLDYCFVPREWASKIRRAEVRPYEECRALSDHAPLVVEIEI